MQTQFKRFVFTTLLINAEGETLKTFKVAAYDMLDAVDETINWLEDKGELPEGSDVILDDTVEETPFNKSSKVDIQ